MFGILRIGVFFSILAISFGTGCGGDSTNGNKPTCNGCLIGQVCYPTGVAKPGDVCQVCNPSAASSAWSDNDGAKCDDGQYCTINDECSSGTCAGSTRDCGDGVACNGIETCNETDDACQKGQNQCGQDEVCDMQTDTCVSLCTGCVIDQSCYGTDQINPLNPCQLCNPLVATDAWSDNDGASCDDQMYCNGQDNCSGGACSIHNGNPCLQDHACDEERNTCCWMDAYAACNAAGDVASYDSCGNELALIEECAQGPHALCQDGQCQCEDGWTSEGCDRCLRYVHWALGNDSNDGASWLNAKATVQAGIDAALAESCEVWVASGLYRPTDGTDRTATFRLRPGVDVYGGFGGFESSRRQRDVETMVTVLSGDLGVLGYPGDNVYHVVTGSDQAVLDGFLITDGYAGEYDTERGNGGGMYNHFASPNVSNCSFEDNYALNGGGMYNHNAHPTVNNCTFLDNSASFGAGMYNHNASPSLTNCMFEDNSVNHSGAGMYNSFSFPTVANCTFKNNSSTFNGGGMANASSSSPFVTNCTFQGNSANDGGGMYNFPSSPAVINCSFQANLAQLGGGISNYSSSPTVFNCSFQGNEAVDGGGMYNENSPSTVINCTFQGNSAVDKGGGLSNNYSSPIVSNCILWGNTGPLDPQIHNTLGSFPAITHCDVEGAGYVGTDGNISLDPRFVNTDPGAGPIDLGLQPTSSCIDAANDTVAPPTDMVGSLRIDDPAIQNCATPGEADCDWYADMGAYEFGNAPSCDPVSTPGRHQEGMYWPVCQEQNWSEAEATCKHFFGHLTTILDQAENDILKGLLVDDWWIGASDLASESVWTWTGPGNYAYTNWATGQPDGNTSENCAAISGQSGTWSDQPCDSEKPFVCEIRPVLSCENPQSFNGHTYVFCNDLITWQEARGVCQQIYGVDLAVIESQEEQDFVWNLTLGESIWLGATDVMEEETWVWVDGQQMGSVAAGWDMYENWAASQPDNESAAEHCLLSHDDGLWYDNRCFYQFPFVCESK